MVEDKSISSFRYSKTHRWVYSILLGVEYVEYFRVSYKFLNKQANNKSYQHFRLLFLLFLRQKKCTSTLSIDQSADTLFWSFCVEIFNEMECKHRHDWNHNLSATSAALPPRSHDLFLEQGNAFPKIFVRVVWNTWWVGSDGWRCLGLFRKKYFETQGHLLTITQNSKFSQDIPIGSGAL